MCPSVSIRKLGCEDFPLFRKWLLKPHVAEWYTDPLDWIDEAEHRTEKYPWLFHFIAEADGVPIGFCQYYLYQNSGENWHGSIVLDGTYSIDYLIGETDYLARGFGREIILALVREVSRLPDAKRIIVQPEEENLASCSALRSSGFRFDAFNRIFIFEIS